METGTNDKLAGAKKLLETFIAGHINFAMADATARRYYANQNDILNEKKKREADKEKPELRNADNRIPSASAESSSNTPVVLRSRRPTGNRSFLLRETIKIGRASCRERVCLYV